MSAVTTPPPRPQPLSQPQSPVAQDRQREKTELNELNFRLERYITAVQDLNKEKDELTARLAEATRDSNTPMKKAYEDKIEHLRLQVVTLQKEKQLLKQQFEKRDAEVRDMEGKNDKLAKSLYDAERKLIELEQKIPDLEEQCRFLNQLHHDDIESIKRKIAARDDEIHKLKNQLKEELEKALEKEKKDWDEKTQGERNALINYYDDIIAGINAQVDTVNTENTNLRVDAVAHNQTIKKLNETLAELRRENQKLRDELHRLQDETNSNVTRLASQVSEKTQELKKVKEDAKKKDGELAALSSENISLAHEIEMYRKLLSEEEARLGIRGSDSESQGSSSSSGQPSKKAKHQAGSSKGGNELFSKTLTLNAPTFNPATFQGNRTPRTPKSTFSEEGQASTSAAASAAQGATSPKSPNLKTIPKKTGIANIEELDIQGSTLRVSNLTSSDINVSGWWIQAGKEKGNARPKRFKFPENSELPADSEIRVKVRIEQEGDSEDNSMLSVDSSLIGAGSYVQLFNKDDELISQIDIVEEEDEEKEGTFERVCAMM